MRKRKRLKVGKRYYSIKYKSRLMYGKSACWAITDLVAKQIVLQSRMSARRERQTRIHECIHVLMPRLKEPIVRALATKFEVLLHDNPGLL